MIDPPADAAPATSRADGFDKAVYAIEQGLICGALLVMTFTYFLSIVHREMRASVNAFDVMFLRWRGLDPQTAPPDVLTVVTDIQTPSVLFVLTFVMAWLAIRTRARIAADRGESPAPRSVAWRVVVSLGLTSAAYGFLHLVEAVPARWLCILVVAAMLVPAVRAGLRNRSWPGLVGNLTGASAMAWFFFTNVGSDYTWTVELASVLLMYVGFFGASMATRDGRHIKIDALRKKIPAHHLGLYNAAGTLVTVLFCVLLLVLSVHYVSAQLEHGGILQGTLLPEVVVSMPIAVSLLLMITRFSASGWVDWAAWRRGEAPAPPKLGSH